MPDVTLYVDDAVGEQRRALLASDARPIRLELERAREAESRARLGEVWSTRLIETAPGGGWRIDLGKGPEGHLRTRQTEKWTAGARLTARITSEAHRDKGPTAEPTDAPPTDTPGRLAPSPRDPFLKNTNIIETITGQQARDVLDATLEGALSDTIKLPAGGALWIEQTHALTAIDIDRGPSGETTDDLNLQAAKEAARQLALRSIGGLVVIDFIGAPRRKSAEDLASTFLEKFHHLTGTRADSLGLSRFGLLQVSIPRGRRDVQSAMSCPPAEREALDAIRQLETAARQNRSTRLIAETSREAERWLRSDFPDWETQLRDRIGGRFQIQPTDRPIGAPSIRIRD